MSPLTNMLLKLNSSINCETLTHTLHILTSLPQVWIPSDHSHWDNNNHTNELNTTSNLKKLGLSVLSLIYYCSTFTFLALHLLRNVNADHLKRKGDLDCV